MSLTGRQVVDELKLGILTTVLLWVALPGTSGSLGEAKESVLGKDLALGSDGEPSKLWNWPFSVEYQAPQVRIRLVDSFIGPPGGWAPFNPSKYTTKRDTNYYYDANDASKERGLEGLDQSDKLIDSPPSDKRHQPRSYENPPVIGSRNIINAPSTCGLGQRRDRKGVCRNYIKLE